MNTTGAVVATEQVRVQSASCASACGADDVYRLRAWETTLSIPRFNNSGTQVTVLLIQNPTDYTVTGNARFWTATGMLTATNPFTLAPKALMVVATQLLAPATSGSITVASDARYGDLAGKSIALEPATGFSFDTEMHPRPR